MLGIFNHRSYSRFLAFSCLLLAGCAGKSVSYTDTVEGTLTLDGVPVVGAHIEFFPEVDSGVKVTSSSATTDEKGYFKLTRNDNKQPGAYVGTHRVVVFPDRDDGSRSRDDGHEPKTTVKVPTVYMNAGQTPFQMTVSTDKKKYDLPMQQNGSP